MWAESPLLVMVLYVFLKMARSALTDSAAGIEYLPGETSLMLRLAFISSNTRAFPTIP
jgi:hypothetical protein